MSKSKESTVVNKLLDNALKDLKSLNKQVPAETDKEVVPVAPPKAKKATPKKKAVKEKVLKPKKAPIKIKRVDDSEVVSTETPKAPEPPPPDPFTKKVLTKTTLKDGMIIVEPLNNPFDD